MKLLGFEIKRVSKALNSLPSYGNGGWRRILEPFSGAFQRNIEEDHGTLLSYPTLYACIMRIATDIGKLPFTLVEQKDGIWRTMTNAAYSPVLRKPNGYQTAQQFREAWLLSKLIQGNAYILKKRDQRGVVTALYVLDPCRVMPMVSDSGNVFYKLYVDPLNNLPKTLGGTDLVIPASEIIHDRCVTLHHWLIGCPPLAAAYWPAIKNLKILKSSADFFTNNAQPGGILTAPAGMTEDDARSVKTYWETNYTGENAGKVAVIGADMKWTSFAMKGTDAQLIEQMRYSDEQICQPFGIPPFIVGIGSIPAGLKVDDVTNTYYSFALQSHIEHIESLLDEGLAIAPPMGVEMDLEPLLRMDKTKQAEFEAKLVGSKIKTPDEGRRAFNLAPTGGGDTLWGQQQDYPLGPLSKRSPPDESKPAPAPAPAPETDPEPEVDETDKALALLWRRSPESHAHV